VMLLSLPGFVFRAAANICRLIAIVTKKELTKWTSRSVRRGSSDRLGIHRAASPPSAQFRRQRSSSSQQSRSDSQSL
ncbi:Hypothetical protein SCF082_LOCUS8483, partial [Durusdinium trenchii]